MYAGDNGEMVPCGVPASLHNLVNQTLNLLFVETSNLFKCPRQTISRSSSANTSLLQRCREMKRVEIESKMHTIQSCPS